MTDLPILFTPAMIRALRDGRKTMTRRIIKPQPLYLSGRNKRIYADADYRKSWREGCDDDLRFTPGDRLWVRESHYLTDDGHDEYAVYAADESVVLEHLAAIDRLPKDFPQDVKTQARKLRPSIHMPRWASRFTLIVESVRVERLQDVSEASAIAEGITRSPHGNGDQWMDYPEGSSADGWLDPRQSFRTLWESINGPDAWSSNPWVAAIGFRVVAANIDAIGKAAP